jgi:hypothetical protein
MSHGSSPASWTAVLVCLAGFTIGGIALIPEPHWVPFTIGAALTVLAGPLGLVMSRMGLGAERAAGHGDLSRGVDEHRGVTD